MQKTVMTTIRCLLDMVKSVPTHKELWDEAVMTSNYLRNRMVSTSGNMPGKTPYEALTGRKPDLSVLRTLGSKAFVHVPKHKRSVKLSGRSTCGTLVGYSPGNFYRVLITADAERSVLVSKDVTLDEDLVPSAPFGAKEAIVDSYDASDEEKV